LFIVPKYWKEQCFSTFFGSKHPVRLEKNWRHPYLAKMTIWGTFSSKKTKKDSNFNIWRHPLHLFTAPLCAAAPRLGTTALESFSAMASIDI